MELGKKTNEMIDTKLAGLKIRFAKEQDIPLIFNFIKELADYESLIHEVIATEEVLRESIFEQNKAEVIIAEFEGSPVGFALFYYSFSTFIGKPAIYLEDLYVKPEYRGKCIGQIILSFLARLSKERNCWGLEWSCLDWNEPSLNFYKKLGANKRSGWTIHRLHGKDLEVLAEEF